MAAPGVGGVDKDLEFMLRVFAQELARKNDPRQKDPIPDLNQLEASLRNIKKIASGELNSDVLTKVVGIASDCVANLSHCRLIPDTKKGWDPDANLRVWKINSEELVSEWSEIAKEVEKSPTLDKVQVVFSYLRRVACDMRANINMEFGANFREPIQNIVSNFHRFSTLRGSAAAPAAPSTEVPDVRAAAAAPAAPVISGTATLDIPVLATGGIAVVRAEPDLQSIENPVLLASIIGLTDVNLLPRNAMTVANLRYPIDERIVREANEFFKLLMEHSDPLTLNFFPIERELAPRSGREAAYSSISEWYKKFNVLVQSAQENILTYSEVEPEKTRQIMRYAHLTEEMCRMVDNVTTVVKTAAIEGYKKERELVSIRHEIENWDELWKDAQDCGISELTKVFYSPDNVQKAWGKYWWLKFERTPNESGDDFNIRHFLCYSGGMPFDVDYYLYAMNPTTGKSKLINQPLYTTFGKEKAWGPIKPITEKFLKDEELIDSKGRIHFSYNVKARWDVMDLKESGKVS